jgi:N-acetylmuramoyl-L-alanine amidase CwlA
MNIKTNLANRNNYGSLRAISDIKFIVIHYTANDGDTDENNGQYFHNNVVGSSAHYFVDDDSITQTVPDNYIAWHCGAKKYKHSSCRNANSIGIEICDDIKNGVIYPSDKTITNVLELVEHLMKKYSIPKENVIRHYDVTGKACPAYWVDDSKWKAEFWNKIGLCEIESVNDIVWELAHRGIITNKELWLSKLEEDTDAYWLARKCANYIRGAG